MADDPNESALRDALFTGVIMQLAVKHARELGVPKADIPNLLARTGAVFAMHNCPSGQERQTFVAYRERVDAELAIGLRVWDERVRMETQEGRR
jgi:hypothetical protein